MEPLKPFTESVASNKPLLLLRSLLGPFAMTAAVVFSFSLLVWQTNKMVCEEVVCRPAAKHYLLEPVLKAGPGAWLIAGLIVGLVAVLINVTHMWWRRAR